jgi:hypothetical protein
VTIKLKFPTKAQAKLRLRVSMPRNCDNRATL